MQVQSTTLRKKGKHITWELRQTLEYFLKERRLKKNQMSDAEIYTKLGISKATYYREVKRGEVEQVTSDLVSYTIYSAQKAQKEYDFNATAKGPQLKIGNDYKMIEKIEYLIIEKHYSPYAALQHLKNENLISTNICLKTLYNYIHQEIFPNLAMKQLPRKGQTAKRKYKQTTDVPKQAHKSITERPAEVLERNKMGHMEMDCVLSGRGGKAALLTIIDRTTRYCFIRLMKDHTQASVLLALNSIEKELGTEQFKRMFKTTTVDNGSEFLDFESLETSSECPDAQRTIIYYCHPYSSHERGTNEQLNGLIRRFVPKGCHIEEFTEERIQEIQDWFNHYPRRILNGSTPAMLMEEYMNSLAPSTALTLGAAR